MPYRYVRRLPTLYLVLKAYLEQNELSTTKRVQGQDKITHHRLIQHNFLSTLAPPMQSLSATLSSGQCS